VVPIKFKVVHGQRKFALSADQTDTLDRITGPAKTSLKKYHRVSVGEVSGITRQITGFCKENHRVWLG
jgi:hypothetical protein